MKSTSKFFTAALTTLLSAQATFGTPTCIVDSQMGKQLHLPVYEWVDNNVPRKGTIVAVHGLTLYAMAWDKLATHLAAKGYRVYAVDQRGFGRWRTEASTFAADSKIEIGQSQQDLLDLVTALRQTHPGQKLFCLGESVGANMCLMLIAEHPDLADGAILASPCHKTRIHPKLRWGVDFAKEVIEPDKPLNLTPYAAPYLTNDPVLAKACDSDPKIYRKMTPVELVKVDVMNDKAFWHAKKLPEAFPLLIVAGAADAMFKQSVLPQALSKFGSKNVKLSILPGKGHLLLEHQVVDPQITSIIDAWLPQQTTSGTLAADPDN
jgi:alpha-beta hydrolase superfamily lysophospholipase